MRSVISLKTVYTFKIVLPLHCCLSESFMHGISKLQTTSLFLMKNTWFDVFQYWPLPNINKNVKN